MEDRSEKLYLLSYRTLPLGYQAIQSAHALREWVAKYPAHDEQWYTNSNSLILVTVRDYAEFQKILRKAEAQGIPYATFTEPDLGYQETAAAFSPGEATAHLLRHCQLLGGPTPLVDAPVSILDWKLHMKRTPQGESGLSVWQHGVNCAQAFTDLLQGHPDALVLCEKIPWLREALDAFMREHGPLDSTKPIYQDILTYLQFHDIGKVETYRLGEDGAHYPDHSARSGAIWRKLDRRERIARWMEQEMLILSATTEECKKIDAFDFGVLRLTASAELLSNARDGLFRSDPAEGIWDSTSVKMKLKKLLRNGRALTPS
jgi:hypothetical protein